MKYYKTVRDGSIVGIGENCGEEEISKEEYEQICRVLLAVPMAEEGWSYRLQEDMTWELIRLSPAPEAEDPEKDCEEV